MTVNWSRWIEQPFAAERDLQRYLAAHPELLSAEAAEDERRRWLLVRREMGVADREERRDRWSLDHLFVDQDAIPTFVEVKRSSDTRDTPQGRRPDARLRRQRLGVLGRGPPAQQLRVALRHPPRPPTTSSRISSRASWSADEFWDAVAANLEERRLRLVFVADRIPR